MINRTRSRSRTEALSSASVACAIRSATAGTPPTQLDAVVRTVSRTLGYGRAGRRISALIGSELKPAERRHLISRTAELIAPEYASIDDYSILHLQECVMEVATREPTDRNEVIVETARLLGFRRTGDRIEERLKGAINGLIRRKRLTGDPRHVWRSRRSSRVK
jgi:hypothetical protein